MIEKCPACGMHRPWHEKGCKHWELIQLAMDMWFEMYEREGRPGGRTGKLADYEHRLTDFVAYPGSSHFPSSSSSSSSVD
jgi:hypothetical protein